MISRFTQFIKKDTTIQLDFKNTEIIQNQYNLTCSHNYLFQNHPHKQTFSALILLKKFDTLHYIKTDTNRDF